MSTEPNLLHQSTLVASDNKSTFEDRMERVGKGEELDSKQDNKKPMTADDVIKLKTGGIRKSQRRRKSQHKRKSQRRRNSQHKHSRKHQRKSYK